MHELDSVVVYVLSAHTGYRAKREGKLCCSCRQMRAHWEGWGEGGWRSIKRTLGTWRLCQMTTAGAANLTGPLLHV